MIRQFDVNKRHGNKLDPRWNGPKPLKEVLPNEVSGFVTDVYGDGRAKRYHLDDLKVYIPRTTTDLQAAAVTIHKSTMKHAGITGQRAVILPVLFTITFDHPFSHVNSEQAPPYQSLPRRHRALGGPKKAIARYTSKALRAGHQPYTKNL